MSTFFPECEDAYGLLTFYENNMSRKNLVFKCLPQISLKQIAKFFSVEYPQNGLIV